jgi:hypothetical protein
LKIIVEKQSRSHWPSDLKRVLFSIGRTSGFMSSNSSHGIGVHLHFFRACVAMGRPLRKADPPSKESYQLSAMFTMSETISELEKDR